MMRRENALQNSALLPLFPGTAPRVVVDVVRHCAGAGRNTAWGFGACPTRGGTRG